MTHWIIIPHVTNWPLTQGAIEDALAQDIGDVGILLINNGSESVPALPTEVLYWRHHPAMLSLSATWNRALGFVWETGESHALVINNDIRMHPCTYSYLLKAATRTGAMLVSATGVTLPQYEAFCAVAHDASIDPMGGPVFPLPGPDFSCFLITKAGHEAYPFDEGYQPAFCEDLDLHRRMMLGRDGQKIFGTGLPYYHVGSSTIKSLDPEKRAALEKRIEQGSRAYHRKKWGGPANGERLIAPFGSADMDGVTTPELFERVRYGHEVLP